MKEIELTQGQVAIVDDEDYEYLSKWKWFAHKNGKSTKQDFYACRTENFIGRKTKMIIMHREIMKPPLDLVVDHINHNTLDNRKVNLRNITSHQNKMNRCMQINSSGYKGVYLYKDYFVARIRNKEKNLHIGYFRNKIDAAEAYDKKAIELYGEFAHLNFPIDKQNQWA